MYNINYPLKIHNSYSYVLRKGDTIIEEKTLYNTADPSFYITSIGNNKTNTAELTFFTGESPNYNYAYGTSLTFKETTNEGSSTRCFEASLSISPTQIINPITKIVLERKTINDEEKGWSTIVGEINKDDTTWLDMKIKIFFEISNPVGNIQFYENNSLKDFGYFPVPAPKAINLSALKGLPSGTLSKKIPTFKQLDTKNVNDYTNNKFILRNPYDSDEGYTYWGYEQNNFGNFSVIEFEDIGGIVRPSSNISNNIIEIPIIIYDSTSNLQERIYNNNTYYQFYCSIPEGSEFDSCYINGVTKIDDVVFNNPLNYNFPACIYDSEQDGDYYCNNLLTNNIYSNNGVLWAPSDKKVCPQEFIISGTLKCFVLGNNIDFELFDSENNDITPSDKSKYKVHDLDIPNGDYKIIMKSNPTINSTDYYTSPLEFQYIPNKTYDPCVFRIGTTDISKTMGLLIPKSFIDNNNIKNGDTISIRVSMGTAFYKTKNTLAQLSYSIDVSQVNNGGN